MWPPLPDWVRNSPWDPSRQVDRPDDTSGDVPDSPIAVVAQADDSARAERFIKNDYVKEAPLNVKLTKMDVTAATGGPVEEQLDFLAHTVVVNNVTNQWVLIPEFEAYIPPYTYGNVVHIPAGTQKAHMIKSAPPGVANAAQAGNQFCWAYWYERELEWNAPILLAPIPAGAI